MTILAYDLGASSGRALLGRLGSRRIEAEEIHRFPNDPVQIGNRLHWDILRLYHEIKQGLLKAKHAGASPSSLAIDSWAVDFGLIGPSGELLGNPYHYRDSHTDGEMERVFASVPKADIFRSTGIQFLPFNTIYQLSAIRRAGSGLLDRAERLLMIPDLLRYFLTGEQLSEFTNATTTQLLSAATGDWDRELIARLGIPDRLFCPVVQPGASAGRLLSSVADELGIDRMQVIAAAEHDTGSAVVAVPALERRFAYLSCGTWSLMGTEVDTPVLSDEALALNFTNEGGACGTYRLLKNIMGLWIVQELQREFVRSGSSLSFPELVALAKEAPAFGAFIDPDDERFLAPGDMSVRIAAYCAQTGQPKPEGPGALMRCVMESLALKYRLVLEQTEQLSGGPFSGLHMVGGGIKNELLCQWTANAIGRPVWAGPAEGSAIGNLAVQWMASGELASLAEARAVIRESFPVVEYAPAEREAWEDAFGRFARLLGACG